MKYLIVFVIASLVNIVSASVVIIMFPVAFLIAELRAEPFP